MVRRSGRDAIIARAVVLILPDTSAWVEFLRRTGSPVHLYLRTLIANESALATTEIVVMELLAGARDDLQVTQLRRLLNRCELISTPGLAGYEKAASLYRQCQRQGASVRRLTDCLVAAAALRGDASVLHADKDFDVLARYCGIKIASPPRGSLSDA